MCRAKVFGYARISKKSQNIERQIRNITSLYPDAKIYKEAFTGTKIQGRKELDKLLRQVKEGDTIVFDSASRMSRNTEEAMALYEELFSKNVNLVFIKEPHINSDTFRQALNNQVEIAAKTGNDATDNFINSIVDALNRYTIDLAKEQIKLVFDQAQKEVDDLQKRTAEGIETARRSGKQIGLKKGTKLTTKKSIIAKEIILKKSCDFYGTDSDKEVMKLADIGRNTFYRYKRQLREQIAFGESQEEAKEKVRGRRAKSAEQTA